MTNKDEQPFSVARVKALEARVQELEDENVVLHNSCGRYEEQAALDTARVKALEAERDAVEADLQRQIRAWATAADDRDKANGLLRAAKKQLEALEAERDKWKEWQPIETAPKDGTWVLLGWFELPGMPRCGVLWHSRDNRWCDVHHVLHNAQSPPTHWMPLPDPPGGIWTAQGLRPSSCT